MLSQSRSGKAAIAAGVLPEAKLRVEGVALMRSGVGVRPLRGASLCAGSALGKTPESFAAKMRPNLKKLRNIKLPVLTT
jgi:hypothetical protein